MHSSLKQSTVALDMLAAATLLQRHASEAVTSMGAVKGLAQHIMVEASFGAQGCEMQAKLACHADCSQCCSSATAIISKNDM